MFLAPTSPGAALIGEPLVRRLSCAYGLVVLAILACLAFRDRAPRIDEAARSGVVGAALAGFVLAAAGAIATDVTLRARIAGEAVGDAARWPQVALVAPLAILAGVAAWRLRPDLAPAAASITAIGAAALGLSFPALVAERMVAAIPAARAPEAPDLRGLALLPVLTTAAAGLGAIIGGAGAPFVGQIVIDCALILAFAGRRGAGFARRGASLSAAARAGGGARRRSFGASQVRRGRVK